MAEALQREMDTYRRLLPTLSGEEGKFALVVGDDLLGTFESFADALKAGYDRAGLATFLVRRISSTESVAHFTRDIAPENVDEKFRFFDLGELVAKITDANRHKELRSGHAGGNEFS